MPLLPKNDRPRLLLPGERDMEAIDVIFFFAALAGAVIVFLAIP